VLLVFANFSAFVALRMSFHYEATVIKYLGVLSCYQ